MARRQDSCASRSCHTRVGVNVGGLANSLAGSGTDACIVGRYGSGSYTDQAPSFASRMTRGSLAQNPGYFCPSAPVIPLTDLHDSAVRNSFKAQIQAMAVGGGTAGHIGAAWGYYMLSPTWSSAVFQNGGGRNYAPNVRKIVVLLTDGIFNTAFNNGGGNYVDNGNPDPALNPAIDPQVPGTAANQALRICDAIKTATAADSAITIYSVGFTTPPSAEAILRSCASPGNFYSADDSAALSATFRSISSALTNLRVTG